MLIPVYLKWLKLLSTYSARIPMDSSFSLKVAKTKELMQAFFSFSNNFLSFSTSHYVYTFPPIRSLLCFSFNPSVLIIAGRDLYKCKSFVVKEMRAGHYWNIVYWNNDSDYYCYHFHYSCPLMMKPGGRIDHAHHANKAQKVETRNDNLFHS